MYIKAEERRRRKEQVARESDLSKSTIVCEAGARVLFSTRPKGERRGQKMDLTKSFKRTVAPLALSRPVNGESSLNTRVAEALSSASLRLSPAVEEQLWSRQLMWPEAPIRFMRRL